MKHILRSLITVVGLGVCFTSPAFAIKFDARQSDAGTNLSCTDCVTLGSETSGNYAGSISEGKAIDLETDSSEGGTYHVSVDTTEIGTTTFGSGSDFTWTFNSSGATKPTMTFSSDTIVTNFPFQFGGGGGSSIEFDGTTEDNVKTILTATDPTSTSKTITLPNATGTVALTSQQSTFCYRTTTPDAGTDDKSIWTNLASNGFTVSELWCESDQTVTAMLQVDDGSPADMESIDLGCNGVSFDTSLNGDVNIAAGERVDLDVASVANSPTWFSICWSGTYDT